MTIIFTILLFVSMACATVSLIVAAHLIFKGTSYDNPIYEAFDNFEIAKWLALASLFLVMNCMVLVVV